MLWARVWDYDTKIKHYLLPEREAYSLLLEYHRLQPSFRQNLLVKWHLMQLEGPDSSWHALEALIGEILVIQVIPLI